MAARPGLCVESLGRQLLVYRDGVAVPPDEIERFFAEAYGLMAVLLGPSRLATLGPSA
jgi:hypothetical protein